MKMKHLDTAEPHEIPAGITHRTLAYNGEAMLCHFKIEKGATIPLHDHRANQIGYVLSGKVAETPTTEKTDQLSWMLRAGWADASSLVIVDASLA